MHEVFISYSHKDEKAAQAVCHSLEERGIRCWMAPRDIKPGESWAGAINAAIKGARIFILIFSKFSNASVQVSNELTLAVNHRLMVIPFRITDTIPSDEKEYFLVNCHWLDAITPPLQDGIDELIPVVLSHLRSHGIGPVNGATGSGGKSAGTNSGKRRKVLTGIILGVAAVVIALGLVLFFGSNGGVSDDVSSVSPAIEVVNATVDSSVSGQSEADDDLLPQRGLFPIGSDSNRDALVHEQDDDPEEAGNEEQLRRSEQSSSASTSVSTTNSTSSSSSSSSSSGVGSAPGTIAGYEYVDLGLSVKWATCNVGASSPEDYGNYYAWGEISPNSSYTKENCKTYGKDMGDIGGNASYDAARGNWGGTWRMPTFEEIDELYHKCTWTWTTTNGKNGYKVTSEVNGKSIFLPVTGFRKGYDRMDAGVGYYWGSEPNVTTGISALSFSPPRTWRSDLRYYGLSVRPVSE